MFITVRPVVFKTYICNFVCLMLELCSYKPFGLLCSLLYSVLNELLYICNFVCLMLALYSYKPFDLLCSLLYSVLNELRCQMNKPCLNQEELKSLDRVWERCAGMRSRKSSTRSTLSLVSPLNRPPVGPSVHSCLGACLVVSVCRPHSLSLIVEAMVYVADFSPLLFVYLCMTVSVSQSLMPPQEHTAFPLALPPLLAVCPSLCVCLLSMSVSQSLSTTAGSPRAHLHVVGMLRFMTLT